MFTANEPEMTEENSAVLPANGPRPDGAQAPEGPASAAVADSRRSFCTNSQYGLLLALGEDPEEYQRMMESLLADLEPREGLESHLVEQVGQTLWRMQRAQRMQDGLALQRIRAKLDTAVMRTTARAAQALELLEPFRRLEAALRAPASGPTAAEIEEFVKSRQADSSAETRGFVGLLESLDQPMEERKRRALRREARAQLGPGLMGGVRESSPGGVGGKPRRSTQGRIWPRSWLRRITTRCSSAKHGGLPTAPSLATFHQRPGENQTGARKEKV